VDVVVRQKTYATGPTRQGDVVLEMDLYDVPGRRPKGAVILVHGGAFTTGHRELPENRAYGEALARRGYVAAAISYRLLGDGPVVDGWAARYARMVSRHPHPRTAGAVQQLGPGFADAVAAAAVDLQAAVGWLRERADRLGFDPSHIAVFGASAGAITALTTAYDMEAYGAEDLDVAAVINLRGRLLAEESGSIPFGGSDPPLMILHGESDDRIYLAEAEAVFRLAREGGTHVEFYTAQGYGHDLGGIELLQLRVSEHENVLDRIDAFLQGAFSGELAQRCVHRRLLPARESESDVEPAAQRSGANLDRVSAALGDAATALLQSLPGRGS
jgi:acetyl esterase/lipase